MSDRTRLTVSYAERDRAAFEAEFDVCDEEDISDEGVVEATYDEVDGGGYDELRNLAAQGIPDCLAQCLAFVCCHGSQSNSFGCFLLQEPQAFLYRRTIVICEVPDHVVDQGIAD